MLKIWEKNIKERDWKYQTPADILIKASNGASDFGNCFGQPLIVDHYLHLNIKKEMRFIHMIKLLC